MSIETQTHIGCLVINLSCGSRAKCLQSEIEKFISKNGVEWTTNRCKAIWNASLHLRNEDPEKAIKVYQDNSIAYHKKSNLPKGHWGYVVDNFIKAQKPSKIRRYASALRFYTSLSLEKESLKQIKKAELSITGSPSNKIINDEYVNRKRKLMKSIDYALDLRISRVGNYPVVSDDQIYADRLKSTSYYYSSRKLPKELRTEPYGSMTMSLMTTSYIPKVLEDRTPCKQTRAHIRKQLPPDDKSVGRIVCIQEQGCKGRVIAQPSAWVQLAFMPLHYCLNSYIRKMYPRQSCLHDQVKGAYAIQEHLASGMECSSVDMSAATDRFPRSVSIHILKKLRLDTFAEAMDDICRQSFNKEFGNRQGTLKYSVGQPMGLYGSFPLFHISNCLVADASVMMTSKPRIPFSDGSYFKVLGDDIVFSDKRIGDTYQANLKTLGVEVSTTKSFDGKVAEFAGFIAVPTKTGVCVFRPYKIPDGNTINNPLEFLHGLGTKVSKLGKYWERQFKAYQATYGKRDLALTPLLPEDKGVVSSNRGDNQRILSIVEYLMNTPEGKDLPVLSSKGTDDKPLFHERRMFDWYGYNRDDLIKDEKSERESFRTIPKRLSQDPLIKEYRRTTNKENQCTKEPVLDINPGRQVVRSQTNGLVR